MIYIVKNIKGVTTMNQIMRKNFKYLGYFGMFTFFMSSPVFANCNKYISTDRILRGSANSYEGHNFAQEVTVTRTYGCNEGTCFSGFISFTRERVNDRINGSFNGDQISVYRDCTACTIPGRQVYEGYCLSNNEGIRGEYLDSNGRRLMGRFRWN